MKFGVRECCDVVFRAKAPMKVGKKIFYKDEPVIYFDTLKTSTLEGAATTVYAQGGRGNARLMSWDGERTVTFTMEDALISPEGLAILTGAGVIEAGDDGKKIYVHSTETMEVMTVESNSVVEDEESLKKAQIYIETDSGNPAKITGVTFVHIPLSAVASTNDNAGVYVMLMDGNDNMIAEPFTNVSSGTVGKVMPNGTSAKGNSVFKINKISGSSLKDLANLPTRLSGYKVLVDYYVEKDGSKGSAMEISITPDKFGGAFYIEASTLFREYPSQQDLPAEFIIPNGRIQSNFNFSMAGSGDPSTFTFTVDAFPDYTRFNNTEKVLATIQVIGASTVGDEIKRNETNNITHKEDEDGVIVRA